MAKDLKGKKLPPGIRQRKNGRYEGRVKYDYKSYSVYGDSISEVKKAMVELRYRLDHNQFVSKTKLTLDDWFDTWINIYKKNSVKLGTIIAYQNGYNYYIKKELGEKKLSDIRGEHLQYVVNKLNKEGLSCAYIKVLMAFMNGCFKQAMKNDLIEVNPVTKITLPKEKEKKARRVLTAEEQAVFLKYAQDSYLYELFALTLVTGMRGGEIRGLKVKDIDVKEKCIYIERTLKYESKMGFFEDTPKTKSSKRNIPLTEDMELLIKAEKQKYHSNIIDANQYLFHLPDGRPISRERVQNEIDRIIRQINENGIKFERFTLHCLRHTFATRAIENGMKPQTLKTIMGHSSLSMTMDLYSHVMETTKKEEMDLISGAFQVI